MKKINQILFEPVDNSPIILFRMIFGLLIMLEAWGAIATGWVTRAFIDVSVTFPFIPFSWLQPLPGNGMYYYYIVMGFAGLMVMLGWRYRWAIGVYTIMWAGVYFMQKTHYNNHYYLLMLLNAMMWLIPAHQYASLDVKRNPGLKNLTCPRWCVLIFVIQITIVYIYASVAKMYPDWIEAKPIAIWFNTKSNYWLIGPLLQEEWLQYVVAYGGILFDLLIAPALMWKKTRKYAFIASIFFHLFNSAVFQVGIFPYMGIAIGMFFFNPETIRKAFFKKKPALSESKIVDSYRPKPVLVYAIALYFVIQLALPMRHHLFDSNVYWTEEGHRCSWRMMLRVKSGYVTFKVVDKDSDKNWTIRPVDYVSYKQSQALSTRPDMCWQFVQILKEDFKNKGFSNIEVYALGKASLNGRPMQNLYDPNYDLATVEWRHFQTADWLVSLEPSE